MLYEVITILAPTVHFGQIGEHTAVMIHQPWLVGRQIENQFVATAMVETGILLGMIQLNAAVFVPEPGHLVIFPERPVGVDDT